MIGIRPLIDCVDGDRGHPTSDGRRHRPVRRHAAGRRHPPGSRRDAGRIGLARHSGRPTRCRRPAGHCHPRRGGPTHGHGTRSGRLPHSAEALTNAARHGTGTADAKLAFGTAALDVTITNAIRVKTLAATTRGHGLIGMRERAALLGGDLEVERAPNAFRISARIPYSGRRS